MKINGQVAKILSHYESDNPGTKANLARMLTHGKLYDPHYHVQLAIES